MIRINHPARLLMLALLCAMLLASLAPGGFAPVRAQTDPATATPPAALPTATPATEPQATLTPGAETGPTTETTLPCELPCLVTVVVSNSTVYALASIDSPRLAAVNSGVKLYALGMDATTLWIELQIAPYTTGWIERSNLREPQILASLPLVATPVPPPSIPTSTSLTLSVWVEHNFAEKSARIYVKGEGFENGEKLLIQLVNSSGKVVQKQNSHEFDYPGENKNQVYVIFSLVKYTPGTYQVVINRENGSKITKSVTLKEP